MKHEQHRTADRIEATYLAVEVDVAVPRSGKEDLAFRWKDRKEWGMAWHGMADEISTQLLLHC